jgi:hypothetical protein
VVVDYANTTQASAARWGKAHRIAAWTWGQGLTPHQLDLCTDAQWARISRAAIGRPASDTTRELTQALLVVKVAWAAAHPTHPAAVRTVLTDDQAAALTAGAHR